MNINNVVKPGDNSFIAQGIYKTMGHEKTDLSKFHLTEILPISLESLNTIGKILDIGGGGEATISQLEGDRVIAIDLRVEELEEIKNKIPSLNSLMLVMDAKELKFIDSSFEVATCFFTLMYIEQMDHKTVLKEIFRVLKPGGKLFIWDIVLPEPPTDGLEKEFYAVKLHIKLPNNEIETGFGTKWDHTQDIDYFKRIAWNVGFQIDEEEIFAESQLFSLFLVKPNNS
ncbi:MAG: class I SAM-dependent methyltransferase [Candidatus Kariarchaeaceae archaeon]